MLIINVKNWKMGIPHYLGSGLAGGDWDTVLELVMGILGKNFQIVVYKLEGSNNK